MNSSVKENSILCMFKNKRLYNKNPKDSFYFWAAPQD